MIMLKEKIGYGLGDMASSMFWKLFGSYLMIFYTDVFGMPAAAVGTMFLVTFVPEIASPYGNNNSTNPGQTAPGVAIVGDRKSVV